MSFDFSPERKRKDLIVYLKGAETLFPTTDKDVKEEIKRFAPEIFTFEMKTYLFYLTLDRLLSTTLTLYLDERLTLLSRSASISPFIYSIKKRKSGAALLKVYATSENITKTPYRFLSHLTSSVVYPRLAGLAEKINFPEGFSDFSYLTGISLKGTPTLIIPFCFERREGGLRVYSEMEAEDFQLFEEFEKFKEFLQREVKRGWVLSL